MTTNLNLQFITKQTTPSISYMNNNPMKKTESQQHTNVIYKFSWEQENCMLFQNIKYFGWEVVVVVSALSRRLTYICHLSSDGPKQHMANIRNEWSTRPIMTDNTKLLSTFMIQFAYTYKSIKTFYFANVGIETVTWVTKI